MKPEISIIMATYNRAHFIVETLQSIQKQTFENFECLIIDDGGTDNTLEVIQPIIGNDKRFLFLKRTEKYKKGLPGCRNYGLDIAKGNYIIFFDDDDIIHSQNLATTIQILKNEDFDFCCYQKESFINEIPVEKYLPVSIEKNISSEIIAEIITKKTLIASCTVLWKKKCFDTIRFNESLMYAEEWECYTRIILQDRKGVQINSILYFNRKHSNSNTSQFYDNNKIRRESNRDAILLNLKSVQSKNLLSAAILKYFIQIAYNFRELNLIDDVFNQVKLSLPTKIYWKIYYKMLPFRIANTRLLKRLKIK
ncbi:MAG TPA: glycosyltransferase family 2 protein [Flavobacterium sp.]|nr:glycosyltransferase family 2 protein [Flavobacterium sp.]